MLVLTRKSGESVVVGDVTFTILKLRGGNVKIGVTAPKSMDIYRPETEEHDGRNRTDDGGEG